MFDSFPADPMTGTAGALPAPAAGVRWVYRFGSGFADGDASMVEQLGGKGAGLAEMARLGVPVPPGFTLVAGACRHFGANGGALPPGLVEQMEVALAGLEAETGGRFGDPHRPLLVSVRSGARDSMPGMMDTILNLGLTDATVEGLAAATGDARFAYDCYRRLIESYGELVMGIDRDAFDGRRDTLPNDDPSTVVGAYRDLIVERTGAPFPQDARVQLLAAIGAVFRSWGNARAVTFRALHGIPGDLGTAATVQAMVFGNRGPDSGTGVAHSRDPSTGAPGLCGEFLANAQGEDVVSGMHTPSELTGGEGTMEAVAPAALAALRELADRLERHFRDLQEIEFTVERGGLRILQTRSGKRSPEATLRVAVDLAEAGVISREEAVRRADVGVLEAMTRPIPDPRAPRTVIARGLCGSPGAAVGALVFTSDEALRLAAEGRPVVLCRPETSPEDVRGMQVACAVVTARGGVTSHAATVARALGLPCVTGALSLTVDPAAGAAATRTMTVAAGDVVTVDGGSGELLLGAMPLVRPQPTPAAATLLAWAAEFSSVEFSPAECPAVECSAAELSSAE